MSRSHRRSHRRSYRRSHRLSPRHSGFGYNLLETLFLGLLLAPFYLLGVKPRSHYTNSSTGR